MPRTPNPNLLLVEGKDERRVIPELIEKHGVIWEPKPKEYCVEIVDAGGIENLLDRAALAAWGKRQGLRRLGLLVDADASAGARWGSVRAAFVDARLASEDLLPGTLPENGLILQSNGIRIGVWLMPDNRSTGMLETFLTHLVGPPPRPVWDYAIEACAEAALRGAAFKPELHGDKARIHCWLAWQQEPGRQLHQAIVYEILDARCPYADPFVAWFRELFELGTTSE